MWGAGNDNFGGGGFVNSQGGGQPFDSPAGGGEKGKGRRANNIVPVTVKQLLDCQEDAYRILDVEAHVITIVGLVKSVETSTTKISAHIDDQTGVIEALNYVGTDEDGSNDVPFLPVEGTYCRVVGGLRSIKGGKYLIIYKYCPVTDMNELTCHMLEVLQVPVKLKKLKETESAKTGVGIGMHGGGMDNTLRNSLTANNFGGGGPGNKNEGGDFPTNQAMVLQFIKIHHSESGIHKDEIFQALQHKFTMPQLQKLMEDLSSEGHIYTTIDDDHFRVTDP